MRAIRSLSLLPIFALLASAAYAADPPEQIVRDYMTALKTEGLVAAPRYMHPDELARFKEMLMPVFRREIADGKRGFIDALYGSDVSIETIEKSSGADVMTALLKLVGDKLSGVEFTTLDMLGSVREGEIVHVVARIGVAGPKGIQVRQMQVISVKPFAGGWKLMLSGEMEGMAAALSAQ